MTTDSSALAVTVPARLLAPPMDLVSAVEAVLFVAAGPVEIAALAQALSVTSAAVETALLALRDRLDGGVRLQRDGDRVQLASAPAFGPYVERYLSTDAEQRLSAAALETLAIIAYKQPVTRPAIEAIRGVNADRVLTTLRARALGLVAEAGRAESVGHPALFVTTMRFLEHFGLERIDELPPLPDDADSPSPLQNGRR